MTALSESLQSVQSAEFHEVIDDYAGKGRAG